MEMISTLICIVLMAKIENWQSDVDSANAKVMGW